MAMGSHSIGHRRSLGKCRRSAAMRPTLFRKRSVWPTNTRGLKGHSLVFVSVQNAHIFRMLPLLCVSSSLAGMVGGCDQIAGGKRVSTGGIPDQTFSAGELEKGGTVWSLAIFPRQTNISSNIDGQPAVSRARLIT